MRGLSACSGKISATTAAVGAVSNASRNAASPNDCPRYRASTVVGFSIVMMMLPLCTSVAMFASMLLKYTERITQPTATYVTISEKLKPAANSASASYSAFQMK